MPDAVESATAIKPDAGTSDADKGGGGEGSSTKASDPFSGLDTGTREWIGTKGYKSIADVAKAAQNAESLIGKSVRLPEGEAKLEDLIPILRKLGAPETADGYEFTRPDVFDEEQFNNDAKALKDALFKAGTPKVVASQIADFVFGNAAEAVKADRAQEAEAAAQAVKDLEAVFGGPVGSDQYKAGVQLSARALTDLGGKDVFADFVAVGLVSEEGYPLKASFGKMLFNIGKQLYREAGAVRGDPTTAGDNPFKAGPKGMNQTTLMKLVHDDRAKAERLMREAGHKPEDFGLKAA